MQSRRAWRRGRTRALHAMTMAALWCAACQPETLGPETWPDAGEGAETASGDGGGGQDAGAVDAGALDAGSLDAGGCAVAAQCGPSPQPCRKFACQAGKCVLVAADDGLSCESDDACVEKASCADGKCAGAAKSCEDQNDCTLDSCDPATGECINKPAGNGGSCDDGQPCTKGDACQGGVCQAGENDCECMETSDCAKLDDLADKCAKTHYCDKSKPGANKCALKPSSGVTCPKSKSECELIACNPKTGQCEAKAANEGNLCDDGNLCAQSECVAGQCKVIVLKCECLKTSDCLSKPQYIGYDPCNGTPYCDKSAPGKWACVINPVTVVQCNHSNDSVCLKNTCVKVADKQGNTLGAKCQMIDARKLRPVCKPDAPPDKCVSAAASKMCPDNPQYCDIVYDPKYNAAVLCDDGNACTANDACKDGACVSGATNLCNCQGDGDCAQLDDGDKCNGVMWCNKLTGKCEINPATVVSCQSAADTACLRNHCLIKKGQCQMTPVEELKTECVNGPKGCDCVKNPELCKTFYVPGGKLESPCDDGDPCTKNDACKGGKCVSGTTNICPCKKNADCAAKDDGNLCNGTLYCDKESGSCKPNPATVVYCPSVDDTFCQMNICDPKTGSCALTPREAIHRKCDAQQKSCTYVPATDAAGPNLSVICDDGDGCTVNDVCVKGKCKPGSADVCVCKTDSDCLSKDDGDLCNGTMYCDATQVPHACKLNPATVKVCPSVDDTECFANLCAKKTGKCAMTAVHENKSCDADGNACTTNDICVKGKCVAGTNICACKADADCATWDDGDKCNGTMYCDTSGAINECKPNPASVVQCDSSADTTCSKNLCAKKTGKCAMTEVPDGKSCDDGQPCTVGDACAGGKCVGGTDICVCKVDADCVDDGNKCNGLPMCDKKANKCVVNPATVVTCKTDLGCAAYACDKLTGQCVPGAKAGACDDKNPCTVDSCETATGKCKHQPAVNGLDCGGGGKTMACLEGSCIDAPAGTRLVAPMTFFRGCNKALDTACAATGEEEPQHEVQLTKAYFIHAREVTVGDYEACVKGGECTARGAMPGCNQAGAGAGDHPANCVTWAQAMAYCTVMKMRLPTEAEWEGAGRGSCALYPGKTCSAAMPTWPWGEDVPSCALTVMHGKSQPGCDKGGTWPVGSRPKDRTPYGLSDMAGNVAEWVSDLYGDKTYQQFKGAKAKDPLGPASGTLHVVRGGSYASQKAADLRLSRRGGKGGSAGFVDVGFRCAKDAK